MTTTELKPTAQKAWAWYSGLKVPFKLLMLFVLLPTAAMAVYMFAFASPMYISESMFAVRSHEMPRGNLDSPTAGLALFRQASPLAAEAFIVKNYIHSVDLFAKVDTRLKLIEHYSDPAHDYFSRLSRKPSQQECLDFWKRNVTATFDPDTGIVTLSVRAFTPQMAQDVARAVLEQCEELVNGMNARAWQDAVSQSEGEIRRARERVAQAQKALQQYRDENGLLDPVASAKTYESIVGVLEGEAARTKAELSEAMSYMRENSPRVEALRSHLRAIESQMAQQKGRLAGQTPGAEKVSGVLSRYQELATELEFAGKQLATSMGMLEQSRVSQQFKSRYVVAFEMPTLPDQPRAPQPFLLTLETFAVLLAGFGLITLIIASVREHMGF